jgi:hypothetical protein
MLACTASYRRICWVLIERCSAVRDRMTDVLRVIQEVADAIAQIYSRASKFSQCVSTGLSGEYAVTLVQTCLNV